MGAACACTRRSSTFILPFHVLPCPLVFLACSLGRSLSHVLQVPPLLGANVAVGEAGRPLRREIRVPPRMRHTNIHGEHCPLCLGIYKTRVGTRGHVRVMHSLSRSPMHGVAPFFPLSSILAMLYPHTRARTFPTFLTHSSCKGMAKVPRGNKTFFGDMVMFGSRHGVQQGGAPQARVLVPQRTHRPPRRTSAAPQIRVTPSAWTLRTHGYMRIRAIQVRVYDQERSQRHASLMALAVSHVLERTSVEAQDVPAMSQHRQEPTGFAHAPPPPL